MRIQIDTLAEATYGAAMAQHYINENEITEFDLLDNIGFILNGKFGKEASLIEFEKNTGKFRNDGVLELKSRSLSSDSQAIIGWYCDKVAKFFEKNPARLDELDSENLLEHCQKYLTIITQNV